MQNRGRGLTPCSRSFKLSSDVKRGLARLEYVFVVGKISKFRWKFVRAR